MVTRASPSHPPEERCASRTRGSFLPVTSFLLRLESRHCLCQGKLDGDAHEEGAEQCARTFPHPREGWW